MIGKLGRIASLGLAGALAIGDASAETNCFRKDDRTSFEVFQIAPPPKFDERTNDYAASDAFYPATSFASTKSDALAEAPPPSRSLGEFSRDYFLWANRCLYVPGVTPDAAACRNRTRTKGNIYPSVPAGSLSEQIRPLFSTYARANACTAAQLGRVVGEDAGETQRRLAEAGLDSIADVNDLTAINRKSADVPAADGSRQRALLDVCLLESGSLADEIDGVVLDYEVWDNRTPDETTRFVTELHGLAAAHGKKLILYTNPIPRVPNGLVAENLRPLLSEVDGFASTVTSGAAKGNPDMGFPARERAQSPWQSYESQLAVLTAEGANPLSQAERQKLMWNISLYDLNVADAQQLHDEIVKQKYRGVMLWRNYVKQGGACSRSENQAIACLTMGQCKGDFGRNRK